MRDKGQSKVDKYTRHRKLVQEWNIKSAMVEIVTYYTFDGERGLIFNNKAQAHRIEKWASTVKI